jgi:hypothetical protein
MQVNHAVLEPAFVEELERKPRVRHRFASGQRPAAPQNGHAANSYLDLGNDEKRFVLRDDAVTVDGRAVLAGQHHAALIIQQAVELGMSQRDRRRALVFAALAYELRLSVGTESVAHLANTFVDLAEEKLVSPISLSLRHDRTSGFAPIF